MEEKLYITPWMTIKVIILAIVVFNIVTAWDEWIDALIKEHFGLDKSVWGRFQLAIVVTALSIAIFALFYTNPVFIIGVSERVLTGQH